MKRSVVVKTLADLASVGRYDNVTPQAAVRMNALFDKVAVVINELEAEEAEVEAPKKKAPKLKVAKKEDNNNE